MRALYRNLAMFAAVAIVLIPATATAQGVLFVESDKVGIGISTPSQALHVFSNSTLKIIQNENTNATAAERMLFRLINNGKVRFVLENTQAGATWTFDNDGNFTISKVGTGVNEMLVDGSGNMTIRGSLTQGSDVNAKTNFAQVNSLDVLQRVLELPIAEWSYKGDDPSVRHLGPVAQDFYGAFSLGHGETGISTLDTSGVALAAIKGLHSLVEARDDEIATLKREVAELRSLILN